MGKSGLLNSQHIPFFIQRTKIPFRNVSTASFSLLSGKGLNYCSVSFKTKWLPKQRNHFLLFPSFSSYGR